MSYKVTDFDALGYRVEYVYPLDRGYGEGSYRVASFVCEREAVLFAEYATRQYELHGTDMDKWDW